MKKIYFLASAVVFTGSLFAQNVKSEKGLMTKSASELETVYSSQFKKKVPGDVIWFEDFTNGISGNSVDGVGTPIGGAWSRGAHNLDAIPDEGLPAVDFANRWTDDVTGSRAGDPSALDWGDPPIVMDASLTGTDSGGPWMIFDIAYNAYQDPNISADGYLNANGYLESPDINLDAHIDGGGSTGLGVQFEQDYATCCAVEGDYNGIMQVGYYDFTLMDYVWKNVSIFSDITNTRYVETPSFTIADVVADAKAQKDAGNSAIVRIRFNWNPEGVYFTTYYWWMLDDVKIVEIEAYNGIHTEMYAGDIINYFDYYAIPESQIVPVTVVSVASNQGGADLTNARLSTVIEDAVPSVMTLPTPEGTGILLPAGTLEVLEHNTGFVPTTQGEYTVTSTLLTDEVNSNGSVERSTTFAITEFEYGHYNPNSTGAEFDMLDNGEPIGLYDIKADGFIYGITLLLDPSSDWNKSEYLTVRIYNGGDATTPVDVDLASPRSETEFYFAQEHLAAAAAGLPITIKLDKAVDVYAGNFMYASFYSPYDNIGLAYDDDGDADNSGSYYSYNDATMYAYSDTYVNLNFDPNLPDNLEEPLSVLDNNGSALTLAQNRPNPATNNTTINYSIANADNVTLEVVDITGKVVATVNEGTRSAGAYSIELNTADFSNGVYFYTLVSGQSKLTNKMIVNK